MSLTFAVSSKISSSSPFLQRRLILRVLDPLDTTKPRNPVLAPNLHSGLQLRVVQAQIIDRAHSRKREPREA